MTSPYSFLWNCQQNILEIIVSSGGDFFLFFSVVISMCSALPGSSEKVGKRLDTFSLKLSKVAADGLTQNL